MKRILLGIIIGYFSNFSFCLAQNIVSTYSGNGNIGYINGSVDSAKFNKPFGMCIDKYNNLYLADGDNNCIRKIELSSGVVSTVAGGISAGWADGSADSALFNSPSDLCIDDSGNIYVSDFLNHRIRKISFNGIVSTIAGSGLAGFANGVGAQAKFNYPRGICRDVFGNLFIGDSWNHRVRKIDMNGNVTTFAGGGNTIGVGSIGALVDASDSSARFYTPSGLTIDQNGNVFVADAYNHRIRKIDVAHNVSTVIGSGATGPGNGGYSNGIGSTAILNTPTEIFIDTSTNKLYIGDTFNNRIRMADLVTNDVTNFAGNGATGFHNDIDTNSTFNYPRGIVVADTSFTLLFVVDYNNHSIRLIQSADPSEISEDKPDEAFNIFPNPVADLINISSVDNLKCLELINSFNLSSRKFLINHIRQFQFDVSDVNPGFYFLKITLSDGRIFVRRIVKG